MNLYIFGEYRARKAKPATWKQAEHDLDVSAHMVECPTPHDHLCIMLQNPNLGRLPNWERLLGSPVSAMVLGLEKS